MSMGDWLQRGPGDLARRMSMRSGVLLGVVSSTVAATMLLTALASPLAEPFGSVEGFVSDTVGAVPDVMIACAMPVVIILILLVAASAAGRPRALARLYVCTVALTMTYLLPALAVGSIAVALILLRWEGIQVGSSPAWLDSPWIDAVFYGITPAAVLAVVTWAVKGYRRACEILSTGCLTCGYSLAGIEARVCPECGRTVERDWDHQ